MVLPGGIVTLGFAADPSTEAPTSACTGGAGEAGIPARQREHLDVTVTFY